MAIEHRVGEDVSIDAMIARLPQPFVLTDPLHDLLEVQWIWQSNFELALDVEEARRRGVPSVLDVLADDGHGTKVSQVTPL